MNVRMHPLAGRLAAPAHRRVAPLAETQPVVARTPPPARAWVAPFGPDAAAVGFDVPSGASGAPRRRLAARVDGTPLRGRSAATSLALRCGGLRRVLVVGLSASHLAERRLVLDVDGGPVAASDPDWLESPLADPAALLDGLDDGGRRRLLRLALTAGARLFGPAAATAFGALAERLLDALDAPTLGPGVWTPVGRYGGIATWRAPNGPAPATPGEVALLAPFAGRRAAGAGFLVEDGPAGRLLHLHLSRPLPAGGVAVGLGPQPLRLAAPDPARARPFARWLAGRSPQARGWALALTEAAAAADPAAAALTRELRHADARPRLALRLAGTPAGLLIGYRLDDPHGLAAALRVERGDGPAVEIPAAEAGASFVPLPRRSAIDDRCRVRLVLGSGRATTVWRGAVPALSGTAPAGFGPEFGPGAVAALAQARLSIERTPRRVSSARFGATRSRPRLSIVAPAEGGPDILRARAAFVATERGGAAVEVVLHALDHAAARLAAEVATVHGVPHRLVVTAGAADAAERALAAVAAAEGEAILLLGDGVLPDGPGWLAPWLKHDAGRPLLAATLLDHDGAVIDAGARLGPGGRLVRPWVGLPARDLPRRRSAPTDCPGASCVGLDAAAARALVAAGPRHPSPDLLVGALAARLAADGARIAIRFDRRFVRYAPPAPRGIEAEADDLALASLVKSSFSPASDEGACAR